MSRTAWLAEVGAYVEGTSTTSLAVGTGSKAFVLAADRWFAVGQTVTADAGSGNTMTGAVTAYDAATRTLTVNVTSTGGSGTYASWTIGGTTTRRFGTEGYSGSGAAGFYEPRIREPANFEQFLTLPGRSFGSGRGGLGELVLVNPDGGLDRMLFDGMDGRSVGLLLGDPDGAYAGFAAVLAGTVAGADFSFGEVRLRLRDRVEETRVPVQPAKYAGTNSGSTGVEGLADDLKGKPKARCWGENYNVRPPAENTSALIYGLNHDGDGNDAPINAVSAVRVSGAAWSLDTGVGTSGDTANLAALQAASITTGQYATCLAAGKLRLGSSPGGQVTVDLQGDKRGGTYRSKAADIAVELLVQVAGIDSGDVSSADVSALNSDNGSAVGIWIDGETTVEDALDQVLGAVGATWWADEASDFRMARIEAPSGTAVATFKRFRLGTAAETGDLDVVSVERLPPAEPGLPAKRTNLSYKKRWSQQSEDKTAGVAAATAAVWAEPWSTVTAADAGTVATKHLLAPEMNVESLLVGASPAQTECDRLQALYGTRRDRYRVTTPLNATAAAIQLGDVVDLAIDRFGLDAGQTFLVTGRVLEAARRLLIVDLWG